MSRNLRTLLKKNRHLEEKIFYDSRQGDWREELITHKELSNALSRLASKIIDSQSGELSVLTLLNDVKQVADRPLAAYEKNALQVVEILFNYMRVNTEFDKRFYHILNSLQLAFTRLALDDLSFLDNPKHPAVTFLEKLINIGYHFDENAGKLASFLVHAIELLVDRLASKEQVSTRTFSVAHSRLDEYLNGFDEKVTQTHGKLLAEIEKKSRIAQANHYTKQLIKSKTDGDEIPIFLLDFFENQLSGVLHQVIVDHGVQSKQCQQLLTDMDTLSWSVSCPIDDPNFKVRFEADVGETMKRLYGHFEQKKLFNEYVKSFFLEIEELHRNKLAGIRVHVDVMISADIFADDLFDVEQAPNWDDTSEAQYPIHQLNEGRWYHLLIDEKKVRCKLLNLNELTEELYFTNLSGELLRTVSFDENQFLVNNLSPFFLDEAIHFKHSLNALERELHSKLEVLNIEYQRFKQQAIIDKKQREQMEERARIAMLHRAEKEKQRAERKRLEAQQKKKQELQRIIELEKIEAEKRFKAKGILRELGPGSTVAILMPDEKWKEASLMIISRTTQRYIFSDASGKKVLEPSKDELINMINDSKIKIIKSNSSDDTLQSLVMQRRQKLSQRI